MLMNNKNSSITTIKENVHKLLNLFKIKTEEHFSSDFTSLGVTKIHLHGEKKF